MENPPLYDPVQNPAASKQRRDVVLARMAQLGDITQAQEQQAERPPVELHLTPQQTGCTSDSAAYAAFFCDYALAVMRHDAAFKQAWARLQGIGGLTIYTTLDRQDENAARNAVNYEMPPPPSSVNPGYNAESEVMIQPGTGAVRAIAIDRSYGNGVGQTTVDYAVGPQYDGTADGVQIGSTGKVYTMVAALEQGIPFGYSKTVPFQATVGPYTSCSGQYVAPWNVHNDESEPGGTYTLYTGTTASINVFFAYLEQKVGLCNVVKTADADGTDLARWLVPAEALQRRTTTADGTASFTLGSDGVAPIDVAAADATLPSRGIYCHPVAITKIVTTAGATLPVESAGCHRVLSSAIADAANYILQGDLTGAGTASGTRSHPARRRPRRGPLTSTGRRSSSATPRICSPRCGRATPADPVKYPMSGYPGSCYQGGCNGFMYGSMAPGTTWQVSFLHAKLTPSDAQFRGGRSIEPVVLAGQRAGGAAPHADAQPHAAQAHAARPWRRGRRRERRRERRRKGGNGGATDPYPPSGRDSSPAAESAQRVRIQACRLGRALPSRPACGGPRRRPWLRPPGLPPAE